MKKIFNVSILLALTLNFTGCNQETLKNVKEKVQNKEVASEISSTLETLTSTEAVETETTTQAQISTKGLSNKSIGWYFGKNKTHSTPSHPSGVDYLDKYDAYYVGDTSKKVFYLTFDEGYENGYSSKILDILKQHNVKAAFFVTKPYIKENPELVKRMVTEGHIVGNHTAKHLSSPNLSDSQLANEIISTADYFKEVTGVEMPKFFRPPMGEFSERTLAVTKNLGYKSIFWSFAYKDWEPDNQPGKKAAYKNVIDNYHNGEIALLHAVSKSNTEALSDIITTLKEKGFTFASLTDL